MSFHDSESLSHRFCLPGCGSVLDEYSNSKGLKNKGKTEHADCSRGCFKMYKPEHDHPSGKNLYF